MACGSAGAKKKGDKKQGGYQNGYFFHNLQNNFRSRYKEKEILPE
jgi:hypothetical protein